MPTDRNLRIRGTVYWFRRRVPKSLVPQAGRKELMRSLGTSCRVQASERSRVAWLATERVFEMMRKEKSLERDQVDAIFRRLMKESIWNSPTQTILLDDVKANKVRYLDLLFGSEGVNAMREMSDKSRLTVLQHLARVVEGTQMELLKNIAKGVVTSAAVDEMRALNETLKAMQADRAASATAAPSQEDHALPAAQVTHVAKAVDVAQAAVPVVALEPPVSGPAINNPEGSAGTLFGVNCAAYLAGRKRTTDDLRKLTSGSVNQADKTFNLWIALMGDGLLENINRVEARRFRDLIRTLPASYGRGARNGEPIDFAAELERAAALQRHIDVRNAMLVKGSRTLPDVPRVSLKTVKRHFSALSTYWGWMETQGVAAEGTNPFIGFKWPGARSGKKARDAWSNEHLTTLLRSTSFSPGAPRATFWWMTVIGMYSGMRAEEIGRLRPHLDIKIIEGIPAFVLQDQGDWSPKSEAGERVIPVHPVLLKLGFMAFVAEKVAERQPRLFADLKPRGVDRSFSADFSRSFSKYKTRLGFGGKTVFHSFRHSVRTILTNAPADAFRDPWIDAILGHAVDDSDSGDDRQPKRKRRSIGVEIYLKEIGIQNLRKVVDAIQYCIEPAAI